jgi:hypothetical protein
LISALAKFVHSEDHDLRSSVNQGLGDHST